MPELRTVVIVIVIDYHNDWDDDDDWSDIVMRICLATMSAVLIAVPTHAERLNVVFVSG